MEPTTITDRLPLHGLHRDAAGNVIGVARAARTGIQIYAGYEVGRPDMGQVRLYRPEGEVFARDSMRTYAGAPVTIEHPGDQVTPENWKDHAVGETESDGIVRDGETVKVPFIVRDAAAIKAIEDGKHEVSMGYTSIIDWTAGQTPDGQAYDAVQKQIRINHLAIVDKARAGPEFRIGDQKPNEEKKVKTILVDGLQVECTDAAETAIAKLLADRATIQASLDAANTTVGTLTADKATLEGKVVALEAQVADAASPEKLHAAATARANLIGDAKRIVPALGEVATLDDAAIKRAVVNAKLGDVGKALPDASVDGAFAALLAQAPAKPAAGVQTHDALTSHVLDDSPADVTSLMDARDKAKAARNERYQNFGQNKATA